MISVQQPFSNPTSEHGPADPTPAPPRFAQVIGTPAPHSFELSGVKLPSQSSSHIPVPGAEPS